MGRHTTRELPVELQHSALSDIVYNKKAVKTNERDPDNTPANSRLFVVCGKDMSEQDLHDLFIPYGKIEYCRLIKDKKTGESKGLCYIKYEKASAAAGALENIDGKQVHENGPVMKVHIADAKGTTKNRRKLYSTEPEDTPPRSRLFVVCPKEMTEETLHARFKQIEGLEYCKVIADKHTGESKGFAYVKFNKASAAALAMESVSESGEIDSMKVKVLIADPKNKRVNTDYFSMNPMEGVYSYPIQIPPYPGVPPFVFPMNYPMMQARLLVSCHKTVSLKELTNLFVHIPGMEHCEFVPMPTMRANGDDQLRYAYVYFSNLQTALLAIDQCNGIEYPAGWTLKCGLEPPIVVPNNSPPETSFLMPAMYSNYQVQDGYGTMGMYPPLPMGYPMNWNAQPESIDFYQQPQDLSNPIVTFSIPGGLSSEEVYSYFGRYGHLEEVDVTDDSGHIVFSDVGSAHAAVAELDGAVIEGRHIDVKFA